MSNIIRKKFTLVLLRDIEKSKILLGYKKRGFGKDKWNGLGGKVEPNESLIECAKRLVLYEE
jgi:8-oxo-dGTP diphosphatase / 2-hydroxy-dATP diphosphatase